MCLGICSQLIRYQAKCTQSQTLRANTFTREQLRTYELYELYELYEHMRSGVPSNRTSVCFYFCRTYKCPQLYPYSLLDDADIISGPAEREARSINNRRHALLKYVVCP